MAACVRLRAIPAEVCVRFGLGQTRLRRATLRTRTSCLMRTTLIWTKWSRYALALQLFLENDYVALSMLQNPAAAGSAAAEHAAWKARVLAADDAERKRERERKEGKKQQQPKKPQREAAGSDDEAETAGAGSGSGSGSGSSSGAGGKPLKLGRVGLLNTGGSGSGSVESRKRKREEPSDESDDEVQYLLACRASCLAEHVWLCRDPPLRCGRPR